jgi:hypothetical protein
MMSQQIARRNKSPQEKTTMSIFGNIMASIFGHSAKAQGAEATANGPGVTTASPSAAASSMPKTAPSVQVDVAAVLDRLAAQRKQKLNWRKSIVDLMKLLDMDSSFAARKRLAKELNYTGNMNHSASMNMWLHKQVMTKLAENGGKVPDELKA